MTAHIVQLVRPESERNEGGHVKTMRRVWHEDSVLTGGREVALWKYLYEMAEWRGRPRLSKGQHPREVWVDRGEIATSVTFLARYHELPVKRVRRILALLEASNRVRQRDASGTPGGRQGIIIKILNYNAYNPLPDEGAHASGTPEAPQRDAPIKRKKEEGKKEEKQIQSAYADSSAKSADPLPPTTPERSPAKPTKADVAASLCQVWNDICGEVCPKARGMTDARRKALLARFAEMGNDPQQWVLFCRKVRASPFLSTKLQPGLDWVIKPANILKILEGNYDERQQQAATDLDRLIARADARATEQVNGNGRSHPGIGHHVAAGAPALWEQR